MFSCFRDLESPCCWVVNCTAIESTLRFQPLVAVISERKPHAQASISRCISHGRDGRGNFESLAAAVGRRSTDKSPTGSCSNCKYHFASAAKQQAYEKFLASAAIAAYNRAGIEPVGTFKLSAKDNPDLKLDEDPTDLWLLLPHKSLNSVLNLESRLAADEAFQTAGREILLANKNDLAFTRYDTSLLYAFDEFQKVAPPAKAETRVLELRTYENPNQERCSTR